MKRNSSFSKAKSKTGMTQNSSTENEDKENVHVWDRCAAVVVCVSEQAAFPSPFSRFSCEVLQSWVEFTGRARGSESSTLAVRREELGRMCPLCKQSPPRSVQLIFRLQSPAVWKEMQTKVRCINRILLENQANAQNISTVNYHKSK